MTLKERLAKDLYAAIREAREDAACISDFQISRRLIEDEYEYKFAALGADADKEVDDE